MPTYELPEDLFLALRQLVGKLACETAAGIYVALSQIQPKPEVTEESSA